MLFKVKGQDRGYFKVLIYNKDIQKVRSRVKICIFVLKSIKAIINFVFRRFGPNNILFLRLKYILKE